MSAPTTASLAPLVVRDLTVAFGRRTVLDGIDLLAQPGRRIGLIGENGAGKSTLLRTVYRVNRPDAGRVSVNGEDAWRQSTAWVARNVGVVLQDMPSDFPLTVRDIVAMGRTAHKRLLEPDTARDRALIDAAIVLQDLDALQGRDRKSTRLNSSHVSESRMPSSA